MKLLNELEIGKIKLEGYWYSKYEPEFPMPKENTLSEENKKDVINKLEEIEKIAEEQRYRGWSSCRICDKSNGSVEFTYNGFRWPSGFMHYIKEHNVSPSKQFLKNILDLNL